jgi:type II secretory pathway component PulM
MRLTGAHRWWTGLARRERAMVLLAASAVLAGLIYILGVEPAWKTRARLVTELPRLQADLVQLESLHTEAQRLAGRGRAVESAQSLQTAAEQSLVRVNLVASVELLDATTVSVRAEAVSASVWFGWLEAFTRESRALIHAASAERAASTGRINASVSFTVDAR